MEFNNPNNRQLNSPEYFEDEAIFNAKKGKTDLTVRLGNTKPFTKELPEDSVYYQTIERGSSTQYEHFWKHIDNK